MKKVLISILALTIAGTAFGQTKDKAMPLFWIREEGKYGYIDKTGKIVIAPQFENTMGFNEGLAATKLGGKYGYIDTKGKWVIKPQFEFTYMFSDGLAMVRLGKQYGWIDRSGRIAIPAQAFDEVATGFREGRLAVKMNGKWGYIDKTGRLVVDAKFDEAKEFNGGVAQVVTDGHRHHWIDVNGRILWSQQKSQE
ncbi:MAG: WG repeat-containing protein [Acidobacteria bacterium]|nr:WG repeat-containing protein [Acidobacteriota bacterium]MBK8149174.1 WG repeat-containing protein [Acidobacteriota bacterium]